MRTILIALLLGALSAPAIAAPKWTVDPAKSTVGFEVQVASETVKGTFATYKADIAFDPANPAGSSAVVTIDLASVKSGDATRDGMLSAQQWFNVAVAPQARFETTSIKSTGANTYEATGKLTIRGVAKPVTLPFTFNASGNQATVTGTTTIKRTDFGVGQGKIASGGQTMDLAAPSTAAIEVKVMVNLTASRTP
jgi:polyisoprenoid-binding protein YceI